MGITKQKKSQLFSKTEKARLEKKARKLAKKKQLENDL